MSCGQAGSIVTVYSLEIFMVTHKACRYRSVLVNQGHRAQDHIEGDYLLV